MFVYVFVSKSQTEQQRAEEKVQIHECLLTHRMEKIIKSTLNPWKCNVINVAMSLATVIIFSC